jgi:hypothetical protein
MVLQPIDRSAHARERRRRQRRRRRARRLAVLLVLATLVVAAGAYVIRSAGGGKATIEHAAASGAAQPAAKPDPLAPRPAPREIRGVHVTMALASLPGKLEEYFSVKGLNTVELDVKDENGEVAFPFASLSLAREIGAARPYYDPKQVALLARARGVYLIGRIVCFEDPLLSSARPARAVRRSDGSVWKNHAGLGWADPYNRANWKYVVDVAVAAAKSGFDEIQFDYVRFPTDGDVTDMVFPARDATPMGATITRFAEYASKRLKPLGVRVSADVFGLSATRNLGIGQLPGRIARYVDAIYPMVYPSHYVPGEYGIEDPNALPGQVVAASLADFKRKLRGTNAQVIPWLQDFSLGRAYTPYDVKVQIDAARRAGSPGFLLWNAGGIYTNQALRYQAR